MALDFGELRYTSSRAYDEDDETDDSRNIEYKLVVELNNPEEIKPKLFKCDVVVLSYGTLVADFCETLLLSKQCVECGIIKVEEDSSTNVDDTGDFHPRKPASSTLFMIHDSVLLCNATQDVTSAVANKFASELLNLVSPSCKVLVLSSHHSSQLQDSYNPSDGSNCIVHSLRSPAFTYPVAYSQLPQPATIGSVPAAALTQCIIKRMPCVAYPVFTETYSTGDLDLVIDSLIKVLHCDPFKNILTAVDLSKMHQYRAKNSRKEMLDRYM